MLEKVASLRLDKTGVWVIEVYPSLLCNQMSENVDLYIKLKLGIFSFSYDIIHIAQKWCLIKL